MLIGHWRLDEGIGTSVSDSSGFGNNGVKHGGSWTVGHYGNAISFDDSDDEVVMDNSEINLGPDFTLACWIKAEPAAGSVSQSIQKMTQSSANLPGEHSVEILTISASDIMHKDVTWCAGEDSVQQVQAKMEQTNTGYVLVGSEDAVEGVVSKSDILGAVSVYLRPLFSKWHRPLDDATLQIKIKWIMSKSVHTVKEETPLSVIMDNMSQFSVRALPVMDQQGKIVGIVTALDIFRALLNRDPNISIAGKTS